MSTRDTPMPEDSRPNDVPWPAARWEGVDGLVLARGDITLRAFRTADVAALFSVLDHDACWAHVVGRPQSVEDFAKVLNDASANGRYVFVVERGDRIVGTTSFLDVSPYDARLEIGSTMYTPNEWGTDLNPACKFLLMAHAFEDLGMGRVQLKTDIRNQRSRSAIERLGAKYEGVLRRYQRRTDGTVRDTVMYSVVVEEWPAVRDGLLGRIAND